MKLSKKLGVFKERGFDYMYSENWISNGKFLLAKSIVSNFYDFIGHPKGKFEESTFNRIVPDLDKCKLWKKTPFIHEAEYFSSRVYKSENSYALLNEEFVKALDLGDLYATDNENAFRNEAGTIVVMPLRVGKFLEALKNLIAV